jgi:hypothetical protein
VSLVEKGVMADQEIIDNRIIAGCNSRQFVNLLTGMPNLDQSLPKSTTATRNIFAPTNVADAKWS